MNLQLLAVLVSQQAALRRKGGQSSLNEIAANQPATAAFPNGVQLSTLTRYRGSNPVSNSRAFGNDTAYVTPTSLTNGLRLLAGFATAGHEPALRPYDLCRSIHPAGRHFNRSTRHVGSENTANRR
jgi:hypothetical protein